MVLSDGGEVVAVRDDPEGASQAELLVEERMLLFAISEKWLTKCRRPIRLQIGEPVNGFAVNGNLQQTGLSSRGIYHSIGLPQIVGETTRPVRV